MNKEKEIIVEAKKYAEELLSKKLPNTLTYHTLEHTYDVVGAVSVIGANENLSRDELEIVQLAGWFHDLGYTVDLKNHEANSIKLAHEFFKKFGYSSVKAKLVESCIRATVMPQNPKSKLEKIICDADLYHISTIEYFKKAELLKLEWEQTQGDKYGKREWLKLNKKFIENHHYFTDYARKNFEEGKQENLMKINKKLAMMDDQDQIQKLQKQIEKLEAKNKKAKEENPERGMQTMFRITSKNHLELSAMADNKANIMISINSIILSILITVLYRKLEEYPYMVIPAVILTVVCLITIVFAILATRPNVSRGKFTKDDINNKKTNLLFFGNFHGMELSEYTWAMNELMKDGQYLYNSLIKDIYFLGKVLGKKYKFLRLSYTIFMFGFVISVISFIVAELFFKEALF
ncbi:MAG: DUF5706 domain-containing protein [Bacteroidetes bacterium]|nr:DUF5706 domain-containing protein [Bacteroidota bacterium]MDA1119235.1 DUF5706 domain-containing protein [Bacteroidota bacterium]